MAKAPDTEPGERDEQEPGAPGDEQSGEGEEDAAPGAADAAEEQDEDVEDEPSPEPAGSAEPKAPAAPKASRRAVIGALAIGLAAGGAGGFFAGREVTLRRRRPARSRPPLAPAFVPLTGHEPRLGPSPAKVTVVEFFDYQ